MTIHGQAERGDALELGLDDDSGCHSRRRRAGRRKVRTYARCTSICANRAHKPAQVVAQTLFTKAKDIRQYASQRTERTGGQE